MDENSIHRVGFVDLFVASVLIGACFFLVIMLYQRAKEHPLNTLLRKAHRVDGYIQRQLARNLYREDFDILPPVMGEGDDLFSLEKCGSVMEGYGFFSVEVTGTEQDIDIMVSPKVLTVQEADVEEIRTPVGFVWVRMQNLVQRKGSLRSDLLEVLKKTNHDFVSASAIYQHFLRIAQSRQSRSDDSDFDIVQNEPAITFKAKEIHRQRYAYKKHLKPRLDTKKVLASYYLKTLFLWLAETETGFDFYNMDDRRLGALFEFMVKKLKDAYHKHLLPHYFIRHWNLLRDFSKEDLEQVEDLLEDLLQNSKNYITYVQDMREYIVPLAKQNNGTYKELLKIIDESFARKLLNQVLVISSSTFATLVIAKCVLNALSLDIALCSMKFLTETF
ncbi:hypothetical protein ACROYT_G023769 [Oculina patagonica]